MKLTEVLRFYFPAKIATERKCAKEAERHNDELRRKLAAAREAMMQETIDRARDA